MSNSVHQDRQGPIWPLGHIAVPTPGTYVSIMSLVDSTFLAAPETPTSYGGSTPEYTNRAYAIIFQACKVGAGPPKLTNNTGNVYIVRMPLASAGGIGDTGTVIVTLPPGATGQPGVPFVLTSAALNRNTLNAYEFYIDADTAADGCQVTLVIQ